MARAELALVIEDSGQAPVGRPAPESVRSEGRASRSTVGGSSTTTTADDDRFPRAVFSFEGSVNDFVQAVARFAGKDPGAPGHQTAAARAEARQAAARPAGTTGESTSTRPGGSNEADSLKGAFKDLAGTFGVLGLLKAIQQTIRGFGQLFFATEAVTKAKVAEAASITIRQVGERTIDGISRPGVGSGGDVPRIPTTALSTRVGPQDALGPVRPAATTAGGGAAEAVTATASIGRLAAGAAVAAAGVVALGTAAKFAGDALDSQARRLSQFSPELARSTAQADIRALRAEIDRARSVGPGLARFQEDWSRMMATFSEMGTTLIELLTNLWDLFRPFVKTVETFIEITAAAFEILVDTAKVFTEFMSGDFKGMKEAADETAQDILKWVRKIADNFGEVDPLADEFSEQFLNSAGLTMEGGPKPRAPNRNAGGFPFGVPFGALGAAEAAGLGG